MEKNKHSGGFNKASGTLKPKKQKNYTHKQLIQKLEVYEKVIKEPKGKSEIDATRRLYNAKRRRNYELRGKQNALFLEGRKVGLHYGKSVEGLERNRNLEDEKTRREVVRKGRAIYRRHSTLSKQFKAKAKVKTRGKGKSK